ncbi:hypothetical protein TREMEDRAFT_26851 [Tremella mesenterica DSM 1558]|uniref:uncharacterized protein n=1 Tax=Tremella mesenterica (strain ATCC 24925 / CBS 8224 / DSM 1558 / NBRC 9311 / NRRL Y-6157 / RJB 2259-6 / UBC 559-6) TaxID=578456 RepID=UPI0003F49CA2|nr:uncharacterized protein TREMEDRAFT_26851 [Tremella mesenterica DSM 1558]EIW72395.1 hypothetical protein TREMEDRAFT_26851 [Tremella mesenterica DSM 1558]
MPSTAKVREKKCAEREMLISDMENLLGYQDDHPEDQEIIMTSPQEIVSRFKSRQEGWSVERVVSAYIRAACAAHRKTNCLTEVLFTEALDEAQQKDKELASGVQPDGPFWGLPSSFKDTFNIAGVDTSLGCSMHTSQPSTLDDELGVRLVKLFRQGGGIPFCKTNVPQTLLAFECCNPIFGRTTNPHASDRTCGGSSGGEAVMVVLRGTPLGWGNDTGGSVRIPAAYSGCCGLKPVRGRLPFRGTRRSVKGFEGIKTMHGPIARNVTDLIYQTRSITQLALAFPSSGEDLIPLPWTEPNLPKKLKIGYMIEDGCVKTSPACARAVNVCVERLRAAGHEVVIFHPPPSERSCQCFVALTSAERYSQLLSNVGSDELEESMKLVVLGSKMPGWVQWAAQWFVRHILKDEIFGGAFAVSRGKSVPEYWEWTYRRDMYAQQFREAAWDVGQFDALICPVMATPALKHGKTKFLSPLAIWCILFNIVEATVGTLPVTRVDPSLDVHPSDFLKDSTGSWILEKRVYTGPDAAYDASAMAGLPVGVQVVGKMWQEEKVLGIMSLLEGLVGYQ